MVNKENNPEGKWTVTPLEIIRDQAKRLAREKFWIRQLHPGRRKGLDTILHANANVDVPYLPAKLPQEYNKEFTREYHGILAYFDKSK